MKLRHLHWFALLCAALLSAGCDQGRPAQRHTTVRIANVAPSYSELNFRREQTNGAGLAFKVSTEASYGEDTYDFFVTASQDLSWTFRHEVRDGTVYTFVLTEDAGQIEPIILEYPSPTANSTDAQIVGLHAGATLPAIDFYLERAGVGIAGATPRATVAFQQQLTPRTVPAGDYEITLTEAGNPSNVLLKSVPIVLGSAPSTFIIVPDGGEGTALLTVLLLQEQTTTLYDINSTSELRVINGAADAVARDFAIDRQFSPPLFSAIPFATPTSFAPVPIRADLPINVTPVGNPGVLELDQTIGTAAAQRGILLFTGNAGTLTYAAGVDDQRRLVLEAKVRCLSAATLAPAFIDCVIIPTDGDATTAVQFSTVAAPGIGAFVGIKPGDYHLYLRQYLTTTLLAGPIPISIAGGGIYSVLAVNGATSGGADVVLFDDFP